MPLAHEIVAIVSASGIDLAALGLAWARIFPSIVIVPAFGLRALPIPARGVLGLTLAISVFPVFSETAHRSSSIPWPALAVVEIAHGIPIAVAAAVPLWAATMAGGLIDNLRGSQEVLSIAVVEGRSSPFGVLYSLLASAIFFSLGGPAHVVGVLGAPGNFGHPVLAMAHDVLSGISIAVAIAGPVLAAAVVIEVAGALVARAASPAQVHALFAPVRSLGLLVLMALFFQTMALFLARTIGTHLQF